MGADISLIETLNEQLRQEFGVHDNNEPKFRVVWSDDQYEYRHGEYHKYSGDIYLGIETGVKFVPKYRQYLPHQWVLERQVPVPEGSEIFSKLSFEPIWAFGELDPNYEVCKIICEKVLHPTKPIKVKYETEEEREERIRELEKYLWPKEDQRTLDTPFVGYGPLRRTGVN